jgi:hypothetical protein
MGGGITIFQGNCGQYLTTNAVNGAESANYTDTLHCSASSGCPGTVYLTHTHTHTPHPDPPLHTCTCFP